MDLDPWTRCSDASHGTLAAVDAPKGEARTSDVRGRERRRRRSAIPPAVVAGMGVGKRVLQGPGRA